MKYDWKQDFSSANIADSELVEKLNAQYQSKAREFVKAHPNSIEATRINWFIEKLEGRILDIGCADGIVEVLAAKKGFEVVGVDIIDECLEKARESIKNESSGIKTKISFVKAWAEKLPFFTFSFDTVILAETLEHVADPFKALEEGHRVLANGGQILISVPNGNCRFPSHFRHYTKESLVAQVGKYFKCSIDESVELGRWIFLRGRK